MSFVIDSSEWNFDGKDVVTVALMLEQLLSRLDTANERNEKVYLGKDLQSRDVANGMDLWAFLYCDLMSDLDGSILDELAAKLSPLEYYEDNEAIWPPHFLTEAVIGPDGIELSFDIDFAHFSSLSNTPMGCLTLFNKGTLLTRSSKGDVIIPLISDEISHKDFWRKVFFPAIRDTPSNLKMYSGSMYPNLWFIEDVWSGVSSFQGGYSKVENRLKKLLECLDDHGAWIFTEPPPALSPSDHVVAQLGVNPPNAIIEDRFMGFGVEVSPEKANVRNDKTCYAARLVNFKPDPQTKDVISLYCEWHGKLEEHINRVHIHAPIPESMGKIIVAIFHKHLPLPS